MASNILERSRYTGPTWVEQQPKLETLQTATKLAVFIDDNRSFSTHMAECFYDIPGYLCLTPPLKESNSDEKNIQILTHFFDALSEEQMKLITLIVVDQYCDNYELRNDTARWITRLRHVNPTAYILEVSGEPREQAYEGSNEIVDMGFKGFFGDISASIRKLPLSEPVRLNALKHLTKREFLSAHRLDQPIDEPEDHPEYNVLARSFQKLIRHPNISETLQCVHVADVDGLTTTFNLLSWDDKRLFLHHLWNLTGHLRMEHDKEFYGGSLSRIGMLLEPYLNTIYQNLSPQK